jgi:UDP-GlcNAc:undecaprenyl-phosphate GlcNAc-1-phosphate transferase
MPSVRDYGVVFGAAAAGTFVVTGIMRWIAPRIGAIVQPDDRRVHERPTPTLGGVAMFAGLIAGVVTAWKMDVFHDQLAPGTESVGMLLAAFIILLVGLIDDIRDISPPAKLAGMVLAGSVLSFAGIGIVVFRVPFLGVTPLTPDLSALITVLWVVGMANAINLIDGPRRSGRRDRGHRRGDVLLLRVTPVPRTHHLDRQPRRARGGDHGRVVPGFPAAQLQPCTHLHG